MPPAYTDTDRRRVNRDTGRGPVRAGLAKPARIAGLSAASTSGEFPRVDHPRLVEAGGIRTPNANTILPARSVIETVRKNKLIDPKRIVDKALGELAREQAKASFSAKAAAAGPKGILNIAKKYAGVPYKWGGTNPSIGLDCSGYTQLVFRQVGINLPRVSRQQATVGRPVSGLRNARPGDLVFYSTNGSVSGVHHVGIYAGNGKYWNAPHTGAVVSLRPVGNPTFIRRVL